MKYSPPEFVEIAPEMRARLERFREQHANDPIGDVANTVLFEDENVRIWEMRLAPGEASDLHHHNHDYYLIIMSGDLVAGIPPKSTGMDPFVGKIPAAGNTVRVPKGGTEWALNVGNKVYHEFLVELKKS